MVERGGAGVPEKIHTEKCLSSVSLYYILNILASSKTLTSSFCHHPGIIFYFKSCRSAFPRGEEQKISKVKSCRI